MLSPAPTSPAVEAGGPSCGSVALGATGAAPTLTPKCCHTTCLQLTWSQEDQREPACTTREPWKSSAKQFIKHHQQCKTPALQALQQLLIPASSRTNTPWSICTEKHSSYPCKQSVMLYNLSYGSYMVHYKETPYGILTVKKNNFFFFFKLTT